MTVNSLRIFSQTFSFFKQKVFFFFMGQRRLSCKKNLCSPSRETYSSFFSVLGKSHSRLRSIGGRKERKETRRSPIVPFFLLRLYRIEGEKGKRSRMRKSQQSFFLPFPQNSASPQEKSEMLFPFSPFPISNFLQPHPRKNPTLPAARGRETRGGRNCRNKLFCLGGGGKAEGEERKEERAWAAAASIQLLSRPTGREEKEVFSVESPELAGQRGRRIFPCLPLRSRGSNEEAGFISRGIVLFPPSPSQPFSIQQGRRGGGKR